VNLEVRTCAPKQKNVAVSELQKVLAEQAATITSLQKENAELHQQNDHLSTELSTMRKKFEQLKDQFKRATLFSSESCLPYALCDNSSSMDDLKQAAKCEHANLKFQEKRAALAGLEVAVEKADEETLSAAITAAQKADVDTVDLEKAEDKLKTLRAMTQEQHGAKAAYELLQKQKKTAFTLVKKDDVRKFKELVHEMGKGVSWRDDLFGRTIWCYAKHLRALRMLEFLEQLGVGDEQPETKEQRPTSTHILQQVEQQHQQPEGRPKLELQGMNQTQCIAVDDNMSDAPAVEQNISLDLSKGLEHSGVDSTCSTPCRAEDSIAIKKSKAFQAAAQDDVRAFNDIIDSVSVDIWSKWENQAGRTLLTLSQERSSDAVHAQVAKALALPSSSSSSKIWGKWSRIMQYT